MLLLPLMLGCASCQWHEAKEVIAVADSIDQTQHVIYDDTAALGGVIRTLENPLVITVIYLAKVLHLTNSSKWTTFQLL